MLSLSCVKAFRTASSRSSSTLQGGPSAGGAARIAENVAIAYQQPTDCPKCTGREFDEIAYAYLLGLYLGDGHIVSKPKQHHLSIFCNATQTGLIAAAGEAMHRVMPLPSVKSRHKPGCVEVKSYTMHWVCMFPQHGPGKKHERKIALEDWQRTLVDAAPLAFLRGCINSDGCVFVNRTGRHRYLSYDFSNRSPEILGLFAGACREAGVDCRVYSQRVRVYRRDSVHTLLDAVGPKV